MTTLDNVREHLPILQGYLEKLGAGAIKKWRRRWFELIDGDLKYYEKRGDPEPLGQLALVQATTVALSESVKIKIVYGERTFKLRAADIIEAKEWETALSKTIQILREVASSSVIDTISSERISRDEHRSKETRRSSLDRIAQYQEEEEEQEACLDDAPVVAVAEDLLSPHYSDFALSDAAPSEHEVAVVYQSGTNILPFFKDMMQKWINAQYATQDEEDTSTENSAKEAAENRYRIAAAGRLRREGYLKKLKQKSTDGKKRWFVLSGAQLRYSDSKTAPKHQSVFIDVNIIGQVALKPRAPTTLFLRTGARTYELKADTEDEAREWVASLITSKNSLRMKALVPKLNRRLLFEFDSAANSKLAADFDSHFKLYFEKYASSLTTVVGLLSALEEYLDDIIHMVNVLRLSEPKRPEVIKFYGRRLHALMYPLMAIHIKSLAVSGSELLDWSTAQSERLQDWVTVYEANMLQWDPKMNPVLTELPHWPPTFVVDAPKEDVVIGMQEVDLHGEQDETVQKKKLKPSKGVTKGVDQARCGGRCVGACVIL